MYPSLGNHDYDHAGPNSRFGLDEWGPTGPAGRRCDQHHAVEFMRCAASAPPGSAPSKLRPLADRFHADMPTRYHPGSLSYSWDRGRYHFVTLNYYPEYENAAVGVESSLGWLRQDLTESHSRGAISVLFIHAAGSLSFLIDEIMTGKGVVAIFAGHMHRCVGHRCAIPEPLAQKYDFQKLDEENAFSTFTCTSPNRSAGSNCSGNMSSNNCSNISESPSILETEEECTWTQYNTSAMFGGQALVAAFYPGNLKDGSIFPCNSPVQTTSNDGSQTWIERPLTLHKSTWLDKLRKYRQGNLSTSNTSDPLSRVQDSSRCLTDMLSMANYYRNKTKSDQDSEEYQEPLQLCQYSGEPSFRQVASFRGSSSNIGTRKVEQKQGDFKNEHTYEMPQSTSGGKNKDINRQPTIPIYWSGSLSFQTFLQVGFNATHMKVEVMSSVGGTARRYVDTPMFTRRFTQSSPTTTASDPEELVHIYMSSDELWGTGQGHLSQVITNVSQNESQHNNSYVTYHCDGLSQPKQDGFNPYSLPQTPSASSWSDHRKHTYLSSTNLYNISTQQRTSPQYPWSQYEDFSPPIRNVLEAQHELLPWDDDPNNNEFHAETRHADALDQNKDGFNNNGVADGALLPNNALLWCPPAVCEVWGHFRCTPWGGCGVF